MSTAVTAARVLVVERRAVPWPERLWRVGGAAALEGTCGRALLGGTAAPLPGGARRCPGGSRGGEAARETSACAERAGEEDGDGETVCASLAG